MSNYIKANKSEILKYSMGGVGSNIAFGLTMMWLTFFYTDIFGISPMAIAGLMLVSRFIDAVTDPLVGMIADRTNTKWGKFRPYVIFFAPFLGIMVFLLFSSPALSPTGKIVYAYVTYIAYSIVSTLVNIPYHSLTPVMTQDPDQRTTVAVGKQVGGNVAMVFVSVLALPLVAAFGGGQTGWMMFGALAGVLTTISFWVCAAGAKKHDKPSDDTVKKEQIPLKTQLGLIYKNKPLLALMVAFFLTMISNAIASGANMYYFTYYLERADLIPIVSLVGLGLGMAIAFLLPMLSKKFGKKKLYVYSSAVNILIMGVLYMLTPESITLVSVLLVLSQGMLAIPGMLGWAMLPDCVEYGEWKLGINGAGTVTSSLTFVNKCGMAIGGSVTGLILGLIGYTAGVEQSQSVLEAMKAMKFVAPIISMIFGIIAMKFYDIDNELYAKMVKENEERRLSM